MKLLTGEGDGGVGGKTVVVGVKLDSHSKELLTWALVKVVEPGDNVIAIHSIDELEGEIGDALRVALKGLGSGDGGSGGGRVIGEGERIGGIDW
ncbi:hypothetical protein CerSpe_176730 [Prunus speciosa]